MTLLMINENCRFCISLLFSLLFFGFLLLLGFFLFPALIILFVVPHQFVPASHRGKRMLLLSWFWAFGTIFEALLAWVCTIS